MNWRNQNLVRYRWVDNREWGKKICHTIKLLVYYYYYHYHVVFAVAVFYLHVHWFYSYCPEYAYSYNNNNNDDEFFLKQIRKRVYQNETVKTMWSREQKRTSPGTAIVVPNRCFRSYKFLSSQITNREHRSNISTIRRKVSSQSSRCEHRNRILDTGNKRAALEISLRSFHSLRRAELITPNSETYVNMDNFKIRKIRFGLYHFECDRYTEKIWRMDEMTKKNPTKIYDKKKKIRNNIMEEAEYMKRTK